MNTVPTAKEKLLQRIVELEQYANEQHEELLIYSASVHPDNNTDTNVTGYFANIIGYEGYDRLKAVNQFSIGQLRQKVTEDTDEVVEENYAITNGVINELFDEVDEVVKKYQEEHPPVDEE